MKPEDKEKLNECLRILDSTDLGVSLVWLWTWSTVKDFLDGEDWDPLVSEDEAWDLLAKAVDSGHGFTLEYGAEDHYEAVLDWMLEKGLIKDLEEEEESGDDETIFE
jgi:hypothetical protein